MTDEILAQICCALERIATALESAPKPAPDIIRDLSEYPGFAWQSINAEVLVKDRHGAAAVRYGDKVYLRRNPTNKFGVAIWYSRATGKDGDDTIYERLITFRESKFEVELLNEKTVEALRRRRSNAS